MRVRNVLVAGAVIAAGLVTTPAAAQADGGDGRAPCNSGEICFQWTWDNFTTQQYQRHFWYNDSNHNNDNWGNLPDHPKPLISIVDKADGIYNRDTECGVTIYDLTSYRTAYATIPRNSKFAIDARNASHKRCA